MESTTLGLAFADMRRTMSTIPHGIETSFPDRIFAEETPTVAGGKPAGRARTGAGP